MYVCYLGNHIYTKTNHNNELIEQEKKNSRQNITFSVIIDELHTDMFYVVSFYYLGNQNVFEIDVAFFYRFYNSLHDFLAFQIEKNACSGKIHVEAYENVIFC